MPKKIILAACALFCLIAAVAAACSDDAESSSVTRVFALDTFVTLTVYGSEKTAKKLTDGAIEEIYRLEFLLDCDAEGGDVWRLNDALGEVVEVSEVTYNALVLAEKYREISGGVFDVTIGGVTALWNFGAPKPVPPDPSDVAAALTHVGKGVTLTVEDGKFFARLNDPEAKVDLGGAAKGIIAEGAADYLIKGKCEAAVIDLGGDVLTVGRRKNDRPWRIGIADPRGGGEIIAATEFYNAAKSDCAAIFTSGDYERYFEYGGVKYHHILDVTTGYPIAGKSGGVTVFCASVGDADPIATVLFCLGYEAGVEFLKSLPFEVGAVFVGAGGEIVGYNVEKYNIQEE